MASSVAQITLDADQHGGIIQNAVKGSALAQITNAVPQMFGSVDYVTLTGTPKAQVVNAGDAKKGQDLGTQVIKAEPIKFHVSQRFQDEADWQDQDYRLNILTQFEDVLSKGIARGVDIVAIHGKDPFSGADVSRMPNPAVKSTNVVTLTAGKGGDLYDNPTKSMYAANGLLMGNGAVATSMAIDPRLLGALGAETNSNGVQINPELGFGAGAQAWRGLPLGISDTLSAVQELGDTGVRAVMLGADDVFRWGVQRQIGIERHVSGDPDNTGRDLAGHNEFLLRAELVITAVWTDLSKVAIVKDGSAGSAAPAKNPA